MSRLTDYAIVLLAHLARSERTLTAHELARQSHVPLPTVSKLCKELSRAGIVASHRGRHGGYSLSRPAADISVAEIVEALEGPISLTTCATPGGETCDFEPFCLAKDTWDPVSRAIQAALQRLPLSSIGPFRLRPSAASPFARAPAVPGHLPVLPGASQP